MGRKDSHPSKTSEKGGGQGPGGFRTSAGRDARGKPEPSNSRRNHPSTRASDEKEAKDPSSSSYSGPNRPRNWLLHDAASDVAFRFDVGHHRDGPRSNKGVRDATCCEIRVQQTPSEETWPGGALWDSGVLLAQLLAVLPLESSAYASAPSRKPASTYRCGGTSLGPHTVTLTAAAPASGAAAPSSETSNVHRHAIHVPSRLLECQDVPLALGIQPSVRFAGASSSSSLRPGQKQPLVPVASPRPISILELGCGVGLTGMVAAVSLRASVTLLTDLAVVVEKVTQPNLKRNQQTIRQHGAGIVRAVPLCWGCERDQHDVRELLRKLTVEVVQHPAAASSSERGRPSLRRRPLPPPGTPDWILVGDVAYQHRPGAPSHFDELLSTLLYFTNPPPPSPPDGNDDEEEVDSFGVTPIVVFGTRIRMPASVDLQDLLLEHFDPVIDPPLEADEINSAFFGQVKKHNMTVHFLRRKQAGKKKNGAEMGEGV